MPITKSAAKAMRSSRRKHIYNLATIKKYKSAIKAVRKAIAGKQKDAAAKLLSTVYKQLDKAAKNHVIHSNKAARLKSRLTAAILKII